jgi:phosphopantetheine--protein transferase-like protein
MKPLPFPFALNIGTDVVHLPRIYRLLTQRGTKSNETYLTKFTRRILCQQEQQDFHLRFGIRLDHTPAAAREETAKITPEVARWLAGRFAAKEAARKAAPGGASSISWKDVLVRTAAPATDPSSPSATGSSKPEVVYLAGAESRLGKLSISHDGDYVVATVLAAG